MKFLARIPRKRWLGTFLVAGVALGASSHEASGVTLDRTGAAVPTIGFYVCHKDLQLVKAGLTEKSGPTQRLFTITLNTYCGVLPRWVSGETVITGKIDWKPVTVHGSYDLDARWAVEVIEVQEPVTKALQANVQCQNNPWVTGQACQLKSLENHTDADANVSYPISAILLPPSLRAALQKWEAGLATADQLKDWNPGASTPKSPHAVVTPNLGLTIDPYGLFQLSLSGPPPPPTAPVTLEWARLTAGKDPSIEPLAYHYGTPATAPQSLSWSQLPLPVAVSGVFTAGLYGVRAKVSTSPVTAWQFFWIGPPDPKLAKHLPGETSADRRRMEFAKLASGTLELSSLRQVILLGQGQSRLINVSELPKLKPGMLRPVPKSVAPKSPAPQSGPSPRAAPAQPGAPKGSP